MEHSAPKWKPREKKAADLIPPGGWIKDRTAADWEYWKQEQLAKRQLLSRPPKTSDQAQRTSLRESGIPEDVVLFVTWFEADRLIREIWQDQGRFIDYELALKKESSM